MAIPLLHSPKVGAMVPPVSMKACVRNPGGCTFQTCCRVTFKASINASRASWSKRRVKSPLVVGSGMRSRAQSVEKGCVVAAQLNVFKSLASQQGIVGKVQHVIAFVIGQVPFEQVQPLINFPSQAQFLAHEVDSTDAAIVGRPTLLGHLEMDVAGAHHRLSLLLPPTFCIQTALDSLLAVTQDFGIRSFHSKCLFSRVWLA